jgi:hypothetical protein
VDLEPRLWGRIPLRPAGIVWQSRRRAAGRQVGSLVGGGGRFVRWWRWKRVAQTAAQSSRRKWIPTRTRPVVRLRHGLHPVSPKRPPTPGKYFFGAKFKIPKVQIVKWIDRWSIHRWIRWR